MCRKSEFIIKQTFQCWISLIVIPSEAQTWVQRDTGQRKFVEVHKQMTSNTAILKCII